MSRFVHLPPRLAAALRMLEGFDNVADIGCDHGRLTAALLQQNACRRVVASDISEPSLEKARQLISLIGRQDSVSFRVGDGLQVLERGECDAIAILGMGGTLMAKLLETCGTPLNGARCVVLQPMRAQDDIRSYLYRNRYHISEDRIVHDHGRFYQILKAEPGEAPDPIPEGFPIGFFDVGYRSFIDRDPLLYALCAQQLACHKKMLVSASGTEGASVLSEKIQALEMILKRLKEDGNETL
jgi:tRNA (adenine22-N1)-methyltransferase